MAELVGRGVVEILPDFSKFGKRMAADMRVAKAQLDGSARGMRAAALTMTTSMARVGKGTSLVVGAVAVASLKMAGDFQAHTAVLQTAAGETASGLKVVRKGIMEIAKGTGTGMTELTEGMYTIEKAGYRGAKGLEILKAASQGAREENASLADVTNAMTSVMASYHLKSTDAVRVMNALKTSAGEGKITMEQFSGALSTVIPIASANKVSFEEVGGAIATLTQHGTSAREATQELASTIRSLASPNMVASREMARFGLSSVDVSTKLGQRGLTGTFELLTETILKRMGPSGVVLMNAFEGTKQAGQDVQIMLKNMKGDTLAVAQEYLKGKITIGDWNKQMKGMPVDQRPMLSNFKTLVDKSRGFSRELKAGGPAAKTYTDALRKMAGGAIGLNTILQLTGESLPGFKERVHKTGESFHNASKDVEGWEVTQKLFNVRLDMAKQTVAALAITIGTKLIPVVTGIADFFGRHEGITLALVSALGLFLGATVAAYLGMKLFAVYTAAASAATALWTVATMAQTDSLMLMRAQLAILWVSQKAVAVWTGIVTAAQWLWNAAMTANPIGIIIVAIAALVGAIIYVATKTTWFQTAWKYTWNALKTAAEATWNVLKPVFSGIWLALRVLATVVGVVLYPFYLLLLQVGKGAMWLWEHAIKPAFSAIGAAAMWLWNTMIRPALNSTGSGFHALGTAASWLYNNAIKPAFNFISAIIGLAIANVRRTFNSIMGFIRGPLAAVFSWLWHNVIQPTWNGIKAFISLAWTTGIKPVFDKIKSAVHLVKLAFDLAVRGIDTVWTGLKKIARAPVAFMVNTIYNGGIVPIWNKVADITHVGHLNPIKGWKDGGHLSGGQPGVDSIPILAMADEFMVKRSSARKVGYDTLNYINDHGQLPGFAAGGQIQRMKDGGPVGWLKGVAKSAFGTAGDIGNILFDPVGMWKTLTIPIRAKIAKIAHTGWGNHVRKIPEGILTGLGNKVKDAAGDVAGMLGFGPGSATGSGGGGVKRWTGVVQQALRMLGQPPGFTAMTLRRMNQESGGNPTVVNRWDSNWKAGHPSVGLMQVIGPTFRSYAGAMRKTGPFMYGVSVNPLANVYSSMRYAMAAYGSLPRAYNRAGGYANGSNGTSAGWHMVGERGMELAHFASGGRVMNHRQTAAVVRNASGGTVTVVVENHGVIGSQHEMEQWLSKSLDNLRRQGVLQGIVQAAVR